LKVTDEKKNIIIDVGANMGLFAIPVAKRNIEKKVIVYEPIPQLYKLLESIKLDQDISNLVLKRSALSVYDGVGKLNVSEVGDWGVSSLLDFNESHISNNEYWQTRKDLVVTEVIDVSVRTLQSELDEIEFNRVSFIKIDSQGLDIDILRSAGKYLNRIDAGMLEAPMTLCLSLYEKESYDLRRALGYLYENDFVVYGIKPNDESSNEFNLFFHRNGLSKSEVEKNCQLCGLDIYDGKNYWHMPSNQYRDVKSELHEYKTKLVKRAGEMHACKTELHACKTELHEYKTKIVKQAGEIHTCKIELNKYKVQLIKKTEEMHACKAELDELKLS